MENIEYYDLKALSTWDAHTNLFCNPSRSEGIRQEIRSHKADAIPLITLPSMKINLSILDTRVN